MSAPHPDLGAIRDSIERIIGERIDIKSSISDALSSVPKAKRRKILRKLGPKVCGSLQHAWDFWARPAQKWTEDGPDIQLWFAGRGSGKTRGGSERCHEVADEPELCGGEILLAAPTATDYRDTMVEGPSGILATQKPWNPVIYEPSKMLLTWTKTKVVGHLRSSEKPRAFRGPNIGFAWIDEVAFWNNVQECWDNIMFALRHGSPSTCMMTTTPLGTEFIKKLQEDPDILIHTGSSYDNRSNLDPKFLARLRSRYEGTALGDQEIHGAVLTQHAFQVFRGEWFGRTVPWSQPNYIATVVAVDPGGGNEGGRSTPNPNQLPPETGIVGMSIDQHGNLYCRGDASTEETNFGPHVVRLANQIGAHRIIAEANYGGGMVKTAIEGTPEFSAQGNLKFELVQSIAGKIDRAIPVAIRAEQGRVFHVGSLATYRDLETQLTSLDRRIPKPRKSPDRADAYVHAALDLMAWYDQRHAGGSIAPIAPENLERLVRTLRRR